MYPPNKLHHRIYNSYCYNKIVKNALVPLTFNAPSDTSAVWLTGLFRSGTTILSKCLELCGANFGPTEDLLQSKGARASLAPDGFLENYMFMEYSVFQLYHAGGWGDIEPSKPFKNPVDIKHDEFVDHCVRKMHDDRISNINKVRLLKSYGPNNLDQYLNSFDTDKPYVKNPHFCLMADHLKQWWPNSKFVVIFKHPAHAIESAKKVSPRVDETLYNSYYSKLIGQKNVHLVFYNELISHTEKIISALCQELSLEFNSDCLGLINKNSAIFSDGSDNTVFNELMSNRVGQ